MTDIVERLNDSLSAGYSELRKEAAVEIMRLRAKIAEMEKQKPVGEIQRANSTGNYNNSVVWVPMVVGSKLYAFPGAKGESE